MEIVCIKAQEWGQKVKVNGRIYEIPADGAPFEVEDDHAEKLLQNESKWRDPSLPIEANQANSAPQISPILTDRYTGRDLSPAETAEVLEKSEPDPEPPAAAAEPEAPAEEPAEPETAEGEGEDTWPEVSTSMKKDLLVAVAEELAEAGYDVVTDGTKAEVLASIEAAYESMS